jgi:hypothetical protein
VKFEFLAMLALAGAWLFVPAASAQADNFPTAAADDSLATNVNKSPAVEAIPPTSATAEQEHAPASVGDGIGPPVALPCCKVPALTAVELEFIDPASSRTSKAGEMISLQLAEPLVVDGRTIAPRGTKAFAEVIQASKAGLMGKAGELTFAARYLEIGETRLPLKRFGYGRSQGSDPSGTVGALNVAAAAVMPIASVALIFVSGGNVDIKAGARAHAVVTAATFVPSKP